MHHFFINKENISGREITFPMQDYIHMTRVLRLKPGETVTASDGTTLYTVKLTSVEDTIAGVIESSEPIYSESPIYTFLVQGIAKGEKMDFIIQKATELGVNEIIPVETEFCVVKLDAKKKLDRAARWQKIANEAAKQSKRALIPFVHTPVAFKEVFEIIPEQTLKIMLWESESKQGLRSFYEKCEVSRVALIIGPEGGFSNEEAELARQKGSLTATLGKRILRTETAGLTALAVTQYALGDLGGQAGAE